MRQLLMTVLLLAVVVSLYSNTVQGNGGLKDQVRRSGMTMAGELSKISP